MDESLDQPVLIYTTFPGEAEAEEAGEALVERRLAACVNIYPGMRSVYRWQGAVERDRETGMFVKTRRALAETVMAALREVHPYEMPALLVIPVEGGSADYCAWIAESTRGGA